MPTVHVSGTDVHYATSGSGPGLVLVHGTSMDAATNFGHMIEHFADSTRARDSALIVANRHPDCRHRPDHLLNVTLKSDKCAERDRRGRTRAD